jgi:hypothetical protein
MRIPRLSVAAIVLGIAHNVSAEGIAHNVSGGAVFVVSVGQPSAETERLLAPFMDEMAHQLNMYVVPAVIRARLGDKLPRPGLADPSLQVADLVKLYEEGYRLFMTGQWDAAIKVLVPAVQKAHDNPALLADQTHHDTWMTGLVALGVSLLRKKELTRSEEVFEELARSFPNQEAAIRAAHGGEPARLYAAAQNALATRGRGSLIVDVNNPTALISVDEWDRPQNVTFEANALPGTYRVLVQMPGTDGLRYDRLVDPNRTTRLSVDLKFDTAITITSQFVALVFASQLELEQYALDYAARLATMIDTANKVVVLVQLTEREGHPAVEGALYRIDSRAWIRGRAALLDGRGDADKLRELAREVACPPVEDPRIIVLPDPASRPTVRGWQLLGIGAAGAFVIGAGLLYVHESCGSDADPCNSPFRSRTPGYLSVVTGVALGALATFLFVRDAKTSRRPSLTVVPSRSSALIGMAMSF